MLGDGKTDGVVFATNLDANPSSAQPQLVNHDITGEANKEKVHSKNKFS